MPKPAAASTAALEAKVRSLGFVHPIWTVQEAARVGLPLSSALAMLRMESRGGHNVFGHDPVRSPQIVGGTVTKARYLRYRFLRNRGFGNQGVGPTQLTGPGLQNQADKIGGCWVVRFNMRTGFKYLAELDRQYHHDHRLAFQHYNGSGPAAVAYGHAAESLRRHYHSALT